jgi:hypothetical protein
MKNVMQYEDFESMKTIIEPSDDINLSNTKKNMSDGFTIYTIFNILRNLRHPREDFILGDENELKKITNWNGLFVNYNDNQIVPDRFYYYLRLKIYISMVGCEPQTQIFPERRYELTTWDEVVTQKEMLPIFNNRLFPSPIDITRCQMFELFIRVATGLHHRVDKIFVVDPIKDNGDVLSVGIRNKVRINLEYFWGGRSKFMVRREEFEVEQKKRRKEEKHQLLIQLAQKEIESNEEKKNNDDNGQDMNDKQNLLEDVKMGLNLVKKMKKEKWRK